MDTWCNTYQGRYGLLFRKPTQAESVRKSLEDEKRLIARLRSNDRAAFLQLYDRFQGIVFRFLLHMTGNEATAEELTQDLFLQIIRGSEEGGMLDRFNEQKGSLEGYLIGIARNLARRRFFQDQRWISLELAPEFVYKPLFLEKVASQSETERLREAILELPLAYREVVILCGLEEKSYEEAARILDRPVGTIASRFNRGRLILAKRLHNKVAKPRREAAGSLETRDVLL